MLARAKRESDGSAVERFNCVIHAMTLFTAGLTGRVILKGFARRNGAPLVNHWRGHAFPDIIQAIKVYDLMTSFPRQPRHGNAHLDTGASMHRARGMISLRLRTNPGVSGNC